MILVYGMAADQLDDEVKNMILPLLNLEDDMYTDLAASVSSMMVRSYAVAIVKPAEGKTDAVKAALEAYVASEQQSMEHYLEDQYQIAKAATVTVAFRDSVAQYSDSSQSGRSDKLRPDTESE